MTKTDLQKELLAKIKPGTKPSDLKKPSQKPLKKSVSPSPIVQDSQKTADFKSDEGYSSEEEKNIPTPPPLPTTKIKQLEKDIKYWSTTANNHLKNLQLAQARISLLEEQLSQAKTKDKKTNSPPPIA
jgi:hypothetical protein